MKLEGLIFHYGNRNPGEFSALWYKFSIPIERSNAKKTTGEKLKYAFGTLEKYLDNGYSDSEAIKKEELQVDPGELTKGFCYSGDSFTATLNYNLNMRNDVVTNISIQLHHLRENHDQLLDLYDAILDIPDLELSEESRSSARKIDCLRKGKDIEQEVLQLPE